MEHSLALIVETNPELARLLARAIEMANLNTQITHTAQHAIKTLAVHTPTLALIDFHLPDLSGEAVIEAIHANPRLSQTRIVLTCNAIRDAMHLYDMVDLILLKPVNFSQLHNIAKRYSQQTPRQKA